ncbi:MAG TPA: ribosome small subunit-dependent GTPase A [Sphingobacteriaceae bacterium]|nr:ribosome small subunit-dependent GTPase A [Sphingobacteriaceae bacterium]
MTGRVIKSYSGWYEVQLDGAPGKGPITCRPRGRLRQEEEGVLTGDRVRVSVLDDGSGVIEEVLPRTSRLHRPPVANVDQVLVVFTLRQPPLNRPVLDRLTCLAQFEGLDVVLVLNKLDLTPPEEVEAIRAEYKPTGYPFIALAAQPPTNVEALEAVLKGRVSVLAGPSGVGKTTLLNALQPGLNLQTQPVSRRLRRGRHTTRHVQLLPLYDREARQRIQEGKKPKAGPWGYVVDTPGFSRLSVAHIPKERLIHCFPDLAAGADRCRFPDCLHRAEPGCAVKALVEEGAASPHRYEQYLELLTEIEELEAQRYR